MAEAARTSSPECNCAVLRKAARRISNYYDSELAAAGLRTTQFAILAMVSREGEVTVNSIAGRLELDRTTAGKNLRPLEAAKLIRIARSKSDKRARAISLTPAGALAFQQAIPLWQKAQSRFEKLNGADTASQLRTLLKNLKTA
jgi:DNA-binding MarR family transcriptional regulator